MNTNIKQQLCAKPQTQEYHPMKMSNQKRPREENMETPEQVSSNLNKKRQPKTLFRPWSNESIPTNIKESTTVAKKDTPPPVISYQPKIALPTAPVLLSPYQMAIQQQQRQTAMALQQAMYQRQLLMAHVWAQQRQQHHQQMMLHHQQQQMRQQLFVFGQKH